MLTIPYNYHTYQWSIHYTWLKCLFAIILVLSFLLSYGQRNQTSPPLKCPSHGFCWLHCPVAFEIFFCPLEPMAGSGSLARLKTSLPPRWWHGLPSGGMSRGVFTLWAKHLRLRNPGSRQTHVLSKLYTTTLYFPITEEYNNIFSTHAWVKGYHFISVGSLPNKAAMCLIWHISVTSLYFEILFGCLALRGAQSNTVITIDAATSISGI